MTKNKKAIIAGVGPGSGMAIAREFAKAGYDIGLMARSKDKLKSYTNDPAFSSIKTSFEPVDFADVKKTGKAVKKLISKMGGVDVLIFNASLYVENDWQSLTAENLMSEIAVGAGSAYAAFREAANYMAKKGGGTLLATGGGSALHPEQVSAAPGLGVTKGALRNLVLAMHTGFAKDNIFLTTVTIDGTVQKGTFFDPDLIAAKIFETAHLPIGARVAEVIYKEQ